MLPLVTSSRQEAAVRTGWGTPAAARTDSNRHASVTNPVMPSSDRDDADTASTNAVAGRNGGVGSGGVGASSFGRYNHSTAV